LAAVETICDPKRDPRRTRVLMICFLMIKKRAGAYEYTTTVTIIVVTGAEARGRREELVFGFSNNCF
jgi:hypothetical protein